MKKLQWAAGILAFVIFGMVLLAGCGNGSGDTFTGILSAQVYATEQSAAEAFAVNELEGQTTEIISAVYQKRGELSRKAIKKLDLGEFSAEDIVSAQEGYVAYKTETNGEGESRLYLLQFKNGYRYYTPLPANGEMLSRSYFESVVNAPDYLNCTYESEGTVTLSEYLDWSTGSTMSSPTTITTALTVMIAEDAAMIKIKMMISEGGTTVTVPTQTIYVVQTSDAQGNGILSGYTRDQTGAWLFVPMDGYSTLDELVSYNSDVSIDHSYLEKTRPGFALSPNKTDVYLRQYVATVIGPEAEYSPNSRDLRCDLEYIVKDGKLVEERQNINVFTLPAGTSDVTSTYRIESALSGKYFDFGSTEVEIPPTLQRVINGAV